ncbi:MAG TPA: mercury(II) reductase [Pseudonocardiaceae bacterium]|jgi:mercuric reductase
MNIDRLDVDLAVVGSGGAAFAAAIAAARKGRTVAMIERGTVGGTCVNTGCVPSKALLAAAHARHVAAAQPFPGISTQAGQVDLRVLVAGKAALIERLQAQKYTALAAEYGWDILAGTATFATEHAAPVLRVELEAGGGVTVTAAHYVVATGATPRIPTIDGLFDTGYLTSTTAMELDRLPRSLIVIGGNSVGLEQAQLFARLGVRVSIVEAMPRLAPFDEPEVSATIEQIMRDEGIAVWTGTTVAAARRGDNGRTLTTIQHGATGELRAERLLMATGRTPMTEGLNLAEVGVDVGPRGEIVVDDRMRTRNPRVWAAGDVTGHPQFVYVAAAHGALVADNAFDGADRALDYRHLPRVTFTSPAIASAGLTEVDAVQQGHHCACRTLPLEYVPRALVDRDTRGLIKLVADADTGRLLGAHAVADGAGEVIAAAVYALANDMTVQQIADLWSPYLTMAEGIRLAAQAFTRDLSKLSCCAA